MNRGNVEKTKLRATIISAMAICRQKLAAKAELLQERVYQQRRVGGDVIEDRAMI
jgi:hypothetical protein